MNKNAALASLGLSGNEDTATVARIYGERLSTVQQQLVAAQTDADRSECQARLSRLVEAYEYVTQTGRYTAVGTAHISSTVVRSDKNVAPAAGGNTLVPLAPGMVLSSRLEVGQLLGQGGMGSVYAARDRLKEEDVAIKVLRQDLLFSAAAKDRFLAEAKVSCSLSHPNIVRVHDVGISGDCYYFSMERLKGQTLRQRIDDYRRANREFEVGEVTNIARQLIEALRYAHRYIVHRDLKPENIWLADDGTVKLMDFGIARVYSSSQLTQTGIALGTAYYMAPEQRLGSKETDWRADQYALAVVLYELLAGTLPTGAVRPLESVRRDLPKRYGRALMRAMASKPEDRFASLNELLAQIEAPERKLAVGLGALLLIAAGVAAAAGGAYVIMSQPRTAPAAEMAASGEAKPSSQPSQTVPADAALPATQAQPEDVDSMPVAAGASDGTPPANAAAGSIAAVVDSAPAASMAAPPASGTPSPAPSSAVPERVAATQSSQTVSRRQQCVAQCESDEAECRSINRRGRQECMRAVAFVSSGRLTTTAPAAENCAFFGQARCDHAINRSACLRRMEVRYQACVDALGGSIVARRQDCEEKARESDRMCRGELADCRASCE